MALYELHDGALSAIPRVRPGPELYEREIEDLVWDDLEAFTGTPLFPVARQARIAGSGIPDVIALDEDGAVVVIEIKRDVDRGQLAQILEYAGWARLTNLDEIARLYARDDTRRGDTAFFHDWQNFTETATPRMIEPTPKLYLIARDFEQRTRSALDFLRENGLPITVVPVTIHADPGGRRIVNIDADRDPVAIAGTPSATTDSGRPRSVTATAAAQEVAVADLIEAGILHANEPVEFVRPRLGEHYEAVILADGTFQLPDGVVKDSPSRAAMHAAELAAYNGWRAWRVPRLGGTKLFELREQLAQQVTSSDLAPAAEPLR